MPVLSRSTQRRRWRAVVLLLLGVVLGPLSACSGPSTPRSASPSPSQPIPTATTEPPATTPPPVTTGPTASTFRSPQPSASPTTPPPETPLPPGAPTCRAPNLAVTDADTVVTQRYREQVFVLRTTGPDCGLSGYPTVALKDNGGNALAVTYSRGGFGLSTAPSAPLTLSRATSASFSLATSRTSPCTDAATISVLLPGTSTPLVARTTARVCQGRAGLSSVRRLHADG